MATNRLQSFLRIAICLSLFGGAICATLPATAAESVNAQILQVFGTATTIASGGLVRPLVPGFVLVPGGRLKTESNARVMVLWTNGAVSILSGGTEVELLTLTLDRAQGGRVIILKLLHGTISTKLVPQPDRLFTFQVKTPRGLVQAEGGAWQITADLNKTVTLAVLRDGATFIFPNDRKEFVPAEHILTIPKFLRPIVLTPDQLGALVASLDLEGLNLTASLAPGDELGRNYLQVPVDEFPIPSGNFPPRSDFQPTVPPTSP